MGTRPIYKHVLIFENPLTFVKGFFMRVIRLKLSLRLEARLCEKRGAIGSKESPWSPFREKRSSTGFQERFCNPSCVKKWIQTVSRNFFQPSNHCLQKTKNIPGKNEKMHKNLIILCIFFSYRMLRFFKPLIFNEYYDIPQQLYPESLRSAV